MKVRTRLLLFGAALPLLGTLAAVLVAGELFYLSLLGALDRSLDELAAIESVSLFDGPDGHPHLPPTEPGAQQGLLARGVVAVYDRAGRPVLRVPPDARVPTSAPAAGQPGLRTSSALGGAPTRERSVRIMSRDGHAFLLWVAAPLGELRTTVATFYQVTLAVCAGMAVLLLGLQGLQARRLSNRIATMARYLPHMREGDFDAELPVDRTGDELAELRTGLGDASRQLKAARERQERLIANAAHEIQTPLACMRTSMDVALMKQRGAEELREALRDSRADVDRLAALSRSLLDLAAAGRVGQERHEVDLGALVRASAEGFRNEADRRGIALATEVEAPELITMGASLALRQALDNLVGNALKFSPTGARVLIRLQRQVTPPGARIIVSDNGPGVPDRARATVFEPFYRASKGAPGSGLGLAIARELARQHGGDVLLLPSAVGACFALDLPLAEPERRTPH